MTRQSGPNTLLAVVTFVGLTLGVVSTCGLLEAGPRDDAEIQAPRMITALETPRDQDIQAPRDEDVQAPLTPAPR